MAEIVKKKISKKKLPKKKISYNGEYPIKRKVTKKKVINSNSSKDTEQLLVENFAALQKVMVNLTSRFDELSNQISKLLNLFEVSAQALAKRNFDVMGNQEIVEKLGNLAEQNKVIARGVSLLHGENPGQTSQAPPQQRQMPPQQQSQEIPQPPQPAPQQRQMPPQQQGPSQIPQERRLMKSISQRDKNIPPHKEIHRAVTDNNEE